MRLVEKPVFTPPMELPEAPILPTLFGGAFDKSGQLLLKELVRLHRFVPVQIPPHTRDRNPNKAMVEVFTCWPTAQTKSL